MPWIAPDTSIPLNLAGLELRERHGYTEAFCPGCGAYVVIGPLYQGQRQVTHQVAHKAPCAHYERGIKEGFENV